MTVLTLKGFFLQKTLLSKSFFLFQVPNLNEIVRQNLANLEPNLTNFLNLALIFLVNKLQL